MKRLFSRIAVLTVLTMMFCGSVHGQVCTDSTAAGRLCLEIQSESGEVLDTPYPFDPNFHEVELNFGSFPYGKAVLKRIMVSNSSAGVNGSISGNTSNGMIWAWQNESPLSFIDFGYRTPTNMGGVKLNGLGTMPIDLVYAPLPGTPPTDGMKVNLEHYPFQYVERVSVLVNPVTFVNSAAGLGKKFDVTVDNNGGELPVLTVTPVDMPALGPDEYLFVYMDKEQLGDLDNPVIPLHFDETAINVRNPDRDQVEAASGQPNWAFYHVPGSQNIVARFRNKTDQNIFRYWFLFKDNTPVRLKNYAYNSSVSTSANMVFVYANADGSRNEFVQPVTVSAQANTNNAPFTPLNPVPSTGSSVDAPTILSWQGGDPDNDSVTYKVEFGSSSTNLSTVAVVQDVTSWTMTGQNLQDGFPYFWRVTSTDATGKSTVGAVWNFTVSSTTQPDGAISFTPDPVYAKKGEKYFVMLKLSQAAAESTEIELSSDSDDIRLTPSTVLIGQNDDSVYFEIEAVEEITSDITVNAVGGADSPYYNNGEPFTLTVKPKTEGTIVFEPAVLNIVPGETREFKVSLSPAPTSEGVTVDLESNSQYLTFNQDTMKLIANKQTIVVTALEGIRDDFPVTITARASDTDYKPATLEVTEDNNPPNAPANPVPSSGDDSVDIEAGDAITVTLDWEGGDPDVGDTISYDLYFGTSETTMSKIATLTDTLYTLTEGNLTYGTGYFWKVVAKDLGGLTTTGGPWNFTTLSRRVRLPIAADPLFNDIDNPEYTPVAPTPEEPIGQPFAVGNIDTGLLTLACKFPVYKGPVDIYLAFMMEGDSNVYVFTKEGGQNSVSAELKPWLAASVADVDEVLFGAIPTELLIKGEWTFISVVKPSGQAGFSSADVTRFKVTVK